MQVWFQDEARFGQQGTLTRQWALKGTRPRAWRQTQYDYLYVFGAACPRTGQTVGLLAPYLNTDTINVFFKEFEKEVDPNVHNVMIWDRAGFHVSGKVKVPKNVTLIELPPYSPQLNPIEKLWQYLRHHYWSNRVYDDYDHLRNAANDAWKRVCLNPNTIKSICNARYINSAVI